MQTCFISLTYPPFKLNAFDTTGPCCLISCFLKFLFLSTEVHVKCINSWELFQYQSFTVVRLRAMVSIVYVVLLMASIQLLYLGGALINCD